MILYVWRRKVLRCYLQGVDIIIIAITTRALFVYSGYILQQQVGFSVRTAFRIKKIVRVLTPQVSII